MMPVARLDPYGHFGPGPFFAGVAVLVVLTAAVFSVVGRRFERSA